MMKAESAHFCHAAVILLGAIMGCSHGTGPSRSGGAASLADSVAADAPNLSADEAKSISVAKEHLENLDGQRVDARYKVTGTDQGYDVHVLYVTGCDENGEPIFIPGGHCTVVISKDWKVLKVLPGA